MVKAARTALIAAGLFAYGAMFGTVLTLTACAIILIVKAPA